MFQFYKLSLTFHFNWFEINYNLYPIASIKAIHIFNKLSKIIYSFTTIQEKLLKTKSKKAKFQSTLVPHGWIPIYFLWSFSIVTCRCVPKQKTKKTHRQQISLRMPSRKQLYLQQNKTQMGDNKLALWLFRNLSQVALTFKAKQRQPKQILSLICLKKMKNNLCTFKRNK